MVVRPDLRDIILLLKVISPARLSASKAVSPWGFALPVRETATFATGKSDLQSLRLRLPAPRPGSQPMKVKLHLKNAGNATTGLGCRQDSIGQSGTALS